MSNKKFPNRKKKLKNIFQRIDREMSTSDGFVDFTASDKKTKNKTNSDNANTKSSQKKKTNSVANTSCKNHSNDAHKNKPTNRFDKRRASFKGSSKPSSRNAMHNAKYNTVVTGIISTTEKGFGFLTVAGEEFDFFVPFNYLHGAMHKDTVRAIIKEDSSARSRAVAEITEIIERGVKTFVAILSKVGRFFCLIPDNHRIAKRVDILTGDLDGAKVGDKVVAEFIEYGYDDEPGLARVVEVLGREFEVGIDILSIIREYGLYEEFPRDVQEAANGVPMSLSQKDFVGREDFRDSLVFSIDGEDAKDLDDAISIERLEGGYRLFVHIADVSHYVLENSAIEKEAYLRGTSVYFPDRVLPMLPRELSNGICSLSEGVDRLTTSCIIDFDSDGQRITSRIIKGIINSRHRMTYTATQGIIDKDRQLCEKYPDLIEPLHIMKELVEKLQNNRVNRGAIELDLPEPKIILSPTTGKIIDVCAYPRYSTHHIIEEFMLAANEAVAEKFCTMGAPFVYRIHETPSEQKMFALQEFVKGLGLNFNVEKDIEPTDIQNLLNRAKDKPYEKVVSNITLRSMQKAKYFESCSGHFGLAAQYYCHFTSPIRRYPDLSIHRIIGQYLKGGSTSISRFSEFVVDSSKRSSEREILAANAERDVDNLKKAEYMEGQIGNCFEGNISGVTAFGLFVELDNTVEGLIRIETLPDEQYNVDEVHFVMRGKKTIYRLGDSLRVKCVSASKESRQVEFVLDDDAEEDDIIEQGRFVPEIKKMSKKV